MRKLRTLLLATCLATSTVTAMAGSALAAASGPSVPIPDIKSTAVTSPGMAGRPEDGVSKDVRNPPPAGAALDGGGTGKATSLAPSATWNVGLNAGDFTWSYPLRVPPAPGGSEPKLALSYKSSTVDGRTSATNNQSSWVGDGWNLEPGFVERTYGPCMADTEGDAKPDQVGDLCWKNHNATASFDSGGGVLIEENRDTGRWRSESDDGSRIERVLNSGNGAHDGESWKITTVDGTQYFFGSQQTAKSVWTVPVYGDDTNEPCHNNGGFALSKCDQPWRWNLDKVIDPRGNTTLYSYETESNSYGAAGKDPAVSYIRGGYLSKVEYGILNGVHATGQVEFTPADRCVPGTDCKPGNKTSWPDVPWDYKCDTATCKDRYSPSFWSTKRLARITASVWTGTAYDPVDSWELEHQYPRPGTGEDASLWLRSITHTGHLGGAPDIRENPVTFEGTSMANRVVTEPGLSPLNRYRITGIVSAGGGVLSVVYEAPDCTSAPAEPSTNTLRCYQARWSKKDFAERTDWFHKYVVKKVIQSDRLAGSSSDETRYEYLDGAAWHFDMTEFVKDDKKSWTEYRGYGRVRVHRGAEVDISGPVTMTENRFYRGMYGDKRKAPAGPREDTVSDSAGTVDSDQNKDHNWLRGFTRETATYLDATTVVSKKITMPWTLDSHVSRGELKSYLVRTGTTRNYTKVGNAWRTTEAINDYDDRGLVTKADDRGDVAVATDDRCTITRYVRNDGAWLLSYPSQTDTVAVKCGDPVKYPDQAISDVQTAYDDKGFGVAPTRGLATRSKVLAEHPANSPAVYAPPTTTVYDAHGRVTKTLDELERPTTTAYTPQTGGPTTRTMVTNGLGHITTVELEPGNGAVRKTTDANNFVTEQAFDSLGRMVQSWQANRDRNTNPDSGSVKVTYNVRNDAPSVVTTDKLGPQGEYVTTKTLYDGLYRPRQTQERAPGGGRLLTDTRYDSQGRTRAVTSQYFNDKDIDDTLWVASDVDIPSQTTSSFDGAGRQVTSTVKGGATTLWSTRTEHFGDHTTVTPPLGGIATTTYTNAQGQTTELRQAKESGYTSTKYTYTPDGQLETVTDPGNQKWTKKYDLRGRLVRDEDPDRGVTTSTYDDAGQLSTSTDARGVTLTHTYDTLGRAATVSRDNKVLLRNTYDTVLFAKGQLASATRYANNKEYKTEVRGYSELYQSTGAKITLPETGRTYETIMAYNVDGSQRGITYPAIGDLPKETVNTEYNALGLQTKLVGGLSGGTPIEYVSEIGYSRYREAQRMQLNEPPKTPTDPGTRVWISTYRNANTRRIERSIVDTETASPMQSDIRYSQDDSGNFTGISDVAAKDNQCFRYDQLRQLTQAWTPKTDCAADPSVAALDGPAPYWHSYTYDNRGNRETVTARAAAGNTVRTSVPGTAHRLDSVKVNGTTTESYGYDNRGGVKSRTVAGRTQTLDWDEAGRLNTVTEGTKTTTFTYGADGSRLLREDPSGTTVYLGDQELRITPSGLTATRYYRLGSATMAMRTGGALTWLSPDHQGTTNLAIDAATLKVTRQSQTPFGEARGTGTTPGERGFVGGTKDDSIGLTALGARQYDAANGRFLSVDPIRGNSDPQQLNGYTYSNNSPVTMSDPSGLWCDMCNDGQGWPYEHGYEPTPPANSGGSGGGGSKGVPKNTKPGAAPAPKPKPVAPPMPKVTLADVLAGMFDTSQCDSYVISYEAYVMNCTDPGDLRRVTVPADREDAEKKHEQEVRAQQERERRARIPESTSMVCVGVNLYVIGGEVCRGKDRSGSGTMASVKSFPGSVNGTIGVKVGPGKVENQAGWSRGVSGSIPLRGGMGIDVGASKNIGSWRDALKPMSGLDLDNTTYGAALSFGPPKMSFLPDFPVMSGLEYGWAWRDKH
nr:RHS repeat-associated core domain-containing protein [Kibdelosporangium sp. MJ126-NF4]CEL19267.1 FIG01288243: hypothetical protein [Kibdelosporangium sp. MJ126-NF4]CTQ94934.1 FIG01288243: hypothetical protein [Kibdelosporangium sp. MJ126-NF4]